MGKAEQQMKSISFGQDLKTTSTAKSQQIHKHFLFALYNCNVKPLEHKQDKRENKRA